MKKHIITIIFAFGFGMSLNAQSDGFFATTYSEYRSDSEVWGDVPALPGSHGINYDVVADPAPLGSGLLLLGGMALAYGLRKRS